MKQVLKSAGNESKRRQGGAMSSSMEDPNPMPDLGDSTHNKSEKDVEAGELIPSESPSKIKKAPEPPQEIDEKAENNNGDNDDIEDGRNKRQSLSSKTANIDSLIVPNSMTSSSQKTRSIYDDFTHHIIVLVNLEQLNNVASNTTTANIPTKILVNKFGFFPGYGRNPDEQSGPYVFVACFYKNYMLGKQPKVVTVERCDTGESVTIQTQETHVLYDRAGIMTAVTASKLHTVHEEEKGVYKAAIEYLAHSLGKNSEHASQHSESRDGWNGMIQYLDKRVLPIWRRVRVTAKSLGTKLVLGASPFSLKIRISGINLLVVCSILFLFLQVFQLGFVSPQFDDELAIVEL